MNTPKLRFKEFTDGWPSQTVGNLTSVSAGATPSTNKKEYWGGNIRWMNSGELNLKRVYEVEGRITEEGYKNASTKLLPEESVLIGLAGQGRTRGTTAINYIPLCTNQSIAAIHPNSDFFIPEFLYQNLNYRYLELRGMSTGDGGRGGLNLQIIKSIPINLPSLAEQKKISSFFYYLDKKISILSHERAILITYKKTVLRKIFNREIRFTNKAGHEYPSWKTISLGEICEPRQHKTISGIDLLPSGYPVYGANGLIGYYDSYNHELETVAITCRGATCGEVTLVPPKSWITGNSMALDNIDEEYSHKFIYYAVINRGFVDVISGSAQPQIVGSAIKSAKLEVPTLDEQRLIADFMSVLDIKDGLIQNQLRLVKKYKQALLQRMII